MSSPKYESLHMWSTWGYAARGQMATKARYLKTPVQLWVADNRKRLGLTPRDIADLTGVTEDTARGWESRGSPSQEAIEVLTRRFGEKPPTMAGPSRGDTESGLADLIAQLIEEQRETRAMLREVLDRLGARSVDQAVARGLEQWALGQASILSQPRDPPTPVPTE